MRTFTAFFFAVTLGLFSLLQTGCGNDAQSKNPEPEDTVVAVPVEAAAVTTGNIEAYYAGTASLEAEEEAMVVARSGGVVEQIFVEEGAFVRAGQALAKLDDARLALEVDRAQMALDKLQRAYERNEELHKKNLISAEEYERVKSDYETQKAARDLAQLSFEYTTVRAPINGVVSERLVKVGNMVGQHEPTFHLTDFDPLLAVMHVPERELGRLRNKQEALLSFDALPGQTFRGAIERISPVVDPQTGTFKVTVTVRDTSRQLKPGMFGRVQIVYDIHENTLLVPKAAVAIEDEEAAVYLVRDSMAYRQVVQTGYEDGRHVEILQGVKSGDLVVTTGQASLRDSSKVEVVE